MNKKRLQRLGVVCMAAAMVLTTVSFPSRKQQVNRLNLLSSHGTHDSKFPKSSES